MNAEIISIGDELLNGDVVNTNSSFIASQLTDIGIEVLTISCIKDDEFEIKNSLSKTRSSFVFITGGLGPTKDDITKKVICDYFNTELVFHSETLNNIKKIFKIKTLAINDLNIAQAEIPKNAEVLQNNFGTAPGLLIREKTKSFFFLPGVPYEMKAILNDRIIPNLKNISKEIIKQTYVIVQGIGESLLAEKISSWENNIPKNTSLAYLPRPGIVRLRLTTKDKNASAIEKTQKKLIDELTTLIPNSIVGYENENIEYFIDKLLKSKKLTISTAESCTGGYIANKLTSIPGSSLYFKGSIIAYSNEVKERILNVGKNTLKNHGAVSKETVIEMAKSIKKQLNTDYSIATSGISGPDGGTKEKPVGTVWICICGPKNTIAEKHILGNDRERHVIRTCLTALNMLRKQIVKS